MPKHCEQLSEVSASSVFGRALLRLLDARPCGLRPALLEEFDDLYIHFGGVWFTVVV